jgi:hypothetical protein
MSRYASLVCDTCSIQLFLGKAVVRPDQTIDRFWRADASPSNASDLVLNRVLWKMLAEHGVHGLRVVVEDDPDHDKTAEYISIGGDEKDDIPFDRYLENWQG